MSEMASHTDSGTQPPGKVAREIPAKGEASPIQRIKDKVHGPIAVLSLIVFAVLGLLLAAGFGVQGARERLSEIRDVWSLHPYLTAGAALLVIGLGVSFLGSNTGLVNCRQTDVGRCWGSGPFA